MYRRSRMSKIMTALLIEYAEVLRMWLRVHIPPCHRVIIDDFLFSPRCSSDCERALSPWVIRLPTAAILGRDLRSPVRPIGGRV